MAKEGQQPPYCQRIIEAMVCTLITMKLSFRSFVLGELRESVVPGAQDYGRYISRMGHLATSKAAMESEQSPNVTAICRMQEAN